MKVSTTKGPEQFQPVAVVIECESQNELDALTAVFASYVSTPSHIFRPEGTLRSGLLAKGIDKRFMGDLMKRVRNVFVNSGGVLTK